jgi:hypothetical protein
MRFFRSEDHAVQWASAKHLKADVITLSQAARLGGAWYENKLSPDWRRHTAAEAEALFGELGLDREFWRLT